MSQINVSKGGPAMSTENQAPGYRVGYARVSTLEQDEALQHDALTRAGCHRIFTDKALAVLVPEEGRNLDTIVTDLLRAFP
jgi:hypothetical protein